MAVNSGRLDVFGMRLPIISDLGEGYFLVGHPNGAGIATKDGLWALELAAGEEPTSDALESSAEGTLPYQVRRDALRKYVEWAWPLLKAELDFTDWNPLPR